MLFLDVVVVMWGFGQWYIFHLCISLYTVLYALHFSIQGYTWVTAEDV